MNGVRSAPSRMMINTFLTAEVSALLNLPHGSNVFASVSIRDGFVILRLESTGIAPAVRIITLPFSALDVSSPPFISEAVNA